MSRTFDFRYIIVIIALIATTNFVNSMPAAQVEELIRADNETVGVNESDTNSAPVSTVLTNNTHTHQNVTETVVDQANDLETAASEKNEQNFVGTVGAVDEADNTAAASGFDPNIYGGLISPETFQQYVNQYGVAYPYAPPYPAPLFPGYAPPAPPPVYQSPYVVQTGYEGYLVPSTNIEYTKTSEKGKFELLMHPLQILGNIITSIMMSSIFRIVAGIVTTLGMIFFGGAITNFLCNYTPICDMSFKAVTYMRRRENAEHVGRMIAEGMTPERVRRATEFVRDAIRKYEELQHLFANKQNVD